MATSWPQIILFGDSITEFSFRVDEAGWGAALADRYTRKADVVVRGFSGYNTRWALYLLDKIFPIPSSNPPLLVTIFFGANDASLPSGISGFQHVPLPEYKQNLHEIISHLKAQSDSTHIILITPPPIAEYKLLHCHELSGIGSKVLPRTNAAAKLYAEECVKVANEAGVRVINIWSIFQEAPNWQVLLSDGLHLSAEGNVKLFHELVKVLEQPDWIPALRVAELPWDSPPFSDVNSNIPDSTFNPRLNPRSTFS